MGLQQKIHDTPFQGEPAPFHWVPAVSNLLLAAGSLLFLTYVAVQLRNLSVTVSDKAAIGKQAAKLKALEKQAKEGSGHEKELVEFKALVAKYLESQKAKEEGSAKLTQVQKDLEKSLASLKSGVKGRKKKQVEAEIKRVKTEGERQIASLKEKTAKMGAEQKKLLEVLKTRTQDSAQATKPGKGK